MRMFCRVCVVCYMLITIGWWCTVQGATAVTFRSRHISPQSIHRRELLSGKKRDEASYIVFVKMDEPHLPDLPGLVSIIERDVYLIDRRSELFQALRPSWYTEYLPVHKSSRELQNETDFIVRVLPYTVIPPTSECSYEQYAGVLRGSMWHVQCNQAGMASYLQSIHNVLSVEKAPVLTTGPMSLGFGNDTTKVTINGSIPIPLKLSSLMIFDTETMIDIPSVTDATILITDSGLDPTHCAFPQARPVISIPNYNDQSCVRGAHGPAVAFLAVGYDCLQGYHGIAKMAPFWLGDMSRFDQENIYFHPCYFQCYFGERSIQVHSTSWGSDGDYGVYSSLSSMFDAGGYERYRTAFFSAAGNEGNGIASSAPGNSKNIKSVGALDSEGNIAYFSNNAPLQDGRRSADLFAPGVSILTANSRAVPPLGPLHADMVVKSGTSFSAPLIAAIALIEEQRRYLKNGEWPYACLIHAIMRVYYGLPRKWTKILFSNMDGDLAIGKPLLPERNNSALVCFKTVGATNLSLAWLDPEATESSSHPLLNDLDMLVISDGGMVIKSDDGAHSDEMITLNNHGGQREVYYRALVYAYANFTVFRAPQNAVRFSMYVRASPLKTSVVSCGLECSPGDVFSCGGGNHKQCRANGTWSTTCDNCALGYLFVSGSCVCDASVLVRNGTQLSTPCAVIPTSTTEPPRAESSYNPLPVISLARTIHSQHQNYTILVLFVVFLIIL